jgi:hypothetical protein
MSLAKKILVLSILVFSVDAAFSQTFMHGAGANIFVTKMQNLEAHAFAGFEYSPRVTFMETESTSLTVGIPLSIGITGSYSYSSSSYYGTYEDNSLGFMFNAPVMINFNVGCGSTKDNESRFGFFAGGGFGYHYQSANGTSYDEYGYPVKGGSSTSDYGPAGNIGFRIAVGSHQKNIETRLSYMKGISTAKSNIFGVGVLFNF